MENKVTNCALCDKQLKENQDKFCSHRCRDTHLGERGAVASYERYLKKFKPLTLKEELRKSIPGYLKSGKGKTFKLKKPVVYKKKVDTENYKEKRNVSNEGRSDTTDHEMWILFWDYEMPRMMKRHFNPKARLPPLPKDSFELETYKICEEKFYTDTFYPYLPSLEERAKMGQH